MDGHSYEHNLMMNFIASFSLFCAILFLPMFALALTDVEVERMLIESSREMSKQLPMGNNASVVVSVFAGPGRHITYASIVSTPARNWTREMKAYGRRIAVNDYCTNPVMAAYREFQVTVSWQNSDKEGVHIVTHTVTPHDCIK